MGVYPTWSKAECDGATEVVAAIIDALGYTSMAARVRGDCLAGLPRYARMAVAETKRQCPALAPKIERRLRMLGLVA